MTETRKGMLLVISGPSGVGKGTLLGRLLADDPSFGFSVSATTRQPREGEVQDVHYHFMTQAHFDELVAQDAFLEHATVHGNSYGTLLSEVTDRMENGQNVVLDIDCQGAVQVLEKMPDCASVFILPPSMQALRERLEGRHTETQEAIERRLGNARGEIAYLPRYRYAIINDDLQTAYETLRAIVTAEKQRISRYCPVIE